MTSLSRMSPKVTLPASAEQRKRLEASAQQLLGPPVAEPAFDDRGVDAAEVGRVDVGVGGVKIKKTRPLAIVSALDGFADDEHEIGGAVVLAETRVLGEVPAEIGKDHHQHLVS